ncbi:SusC/RagA family TonB-linked outer membrane protein [Segetibacter sp. 3557_3]|uniref:SusC/RagA family TonB-linked outer membrane protein n=1 Tax=Segetibacter sp. 3557_3 TaxID=2547429 RepID=UPI001058AF3F|nr:SusC/RagA family TonB-linked outer membrane protein [Segetibacter sp. 3557_3]TDH23464.1 SusC/RagA family TonB-linked outer membrane protein [Segetibacter sp. 3557_3]
MKYFKIWMAFLVILSCLCKNVAAQDANQVTIVSVIYDNKGLPVANALVSGNGGQTTAYTDESGKFSITVPANAVVLINAKGFKMQSLRAGAIPARIGLTVDNEAEMIYLPFSRVNRQDRPGAISVLNPETYIDRDYNFTVEGGMNGRVAGLLSSNNIWGMENAMVMIDGIRREFSDITFPEVQQISVLKGINAVALYGSQAAKGIIFITTKKGEVNTRKISVRVNSGIALPRALPNYLNSADYMTLYNEARRNDGLPELYTPAAIESHRTGNSFRYPNVDYYSSEYLKKFQNATDANAEFSGGSNVARFYSNVGYSNSTTLLNVGEGKDEGDNRLNVRGNVDLKLNDKISSSIYVSAIFRESRRARSSVAGANYWNNAATLLPNRFTPLIPISSISPNDKATLGVVGASRNLINGQYLLGGLQSFQTNPIADLYVAGYDKNIQRVFQVTNEINADLGAVIQGLSFHTLFNLDYSNSYLQSISNTYAVYTPTWSASGDTITGLQKFGEDTRPGTQNINNTAQRQNNSFSAWLGYDRSLNAVHNISAKLLGYTSSITVNDIYQPITNSHLGLQLGYNYKHRYWADFSGAYINSTRLPDGNRTGFSPTASVGWLLTSERFLANSKAVNYLKLSASAGILDTDLDIRRNNQDAFYLYNNIYGRGTTYRWNDDVAGANQTTTSNQGASPDLGFPSRKEVNASLEGSFFNNLITLQTTVFKTKMDGLATQRFSQYPNYFSTFIPFTNYNADQRSGFDVMFNVNKKVGNVELSLGTNATYAVSKVIKRDELFLDSYQNRAGRPVDAIFGLVSNGFYMDQNEINSQSRQLFGEVKPGDIKYVDQNGDKLIDTRDEVIIGRFVAPFTYGINFNVAYKNFNLFVLGTGSKGGNNLRNNNYFWVSGDLKYSDVVLGRWTESTKSTATFPRLSAQQSANNFRTSDFWLYSTDRFNLSKVQLTYNLPEKVSGNALIRGLVVYVAGSNLYTFSKNREILDLSIANTPQFRNYIVGIRAKF